MSPMPNVTNAECHIKALVLILNMLNVVMLSVVLLNVVMLGVLMLSVVMLIAIMLNVIMINVILLSAIMLSVAALFENVIDIHECSYQQPSLPYRIEITPKDIFIDFCYNQEYVGECQV
jgi:hypothetical protein